MSKTYTPFDERLDEIMPGLFISNEWAASKQKHLEAKQIKHILVVGNGLVAWFPAEYGYMIIGIDDFGRAKISDHFGNMHAFIKDKLDKKENVLVHCSMAISRSTTAIAAYLIKEFDMTVDDAMAMIIKSHPEANPNLGFMQQLQEWETKCRGKKAKHIGGKLSESELDVFQDM